MRAGHADVGLSERLLNNWQRGFPLSNRPFALVGQAEGATENEVINLFADGMQRSAISRIGGVWAPGVGGAALLCAMAVPPERLKAVAALVSAHPGVNHNYEREHVLNLWFVITGTGAEPVEQALATIESEAALPVTRLKMVRPYRIDLGFDLHRPAVGGSAIRQRPPRVEAADHDLAALVEAGLPLVAEPFATWADQLGVPTANVLGRIQAWLDAGTLRRFGLVVRHHEVGFASNAMTVFNIDDAQVDALGERLATQPGVTLCYRRERAPGWPYNLYCMVHGRSRDQTLALLHAAIAAAGLSEQPRQVLFSRRRFKQTGARYFRPLPEAPHVR
ncbi:siroheme decarboxylase subunit beta [Ottowia testudinis]|uniref:siroheme decarboxylase n=1 Tax=Ottowia testudinis TaxID=2816950 RepID=A0A975H7R4_9BURK|nr:Lrp/AsnC family transcriptional regulator [Ottowia testudinis]QTD47327.1 Lrp/AsnC family transcriptional regulator [Ottowia testudinis]